MKTGIIIQTRMGSTRLPGKVMLDLNGKPVIQHVIERMKQCKNLDEIIIATTKSDKDDIIVEQADICGVKSFRGSEEDVLERYYLAAKENKLDTIVRITSDCPLIDPLVSGAVIEFYKTHNFKIVSNASQDLNQRTYPRGLDTEVFSFNALEEAFNKADKKYQREHLTQYIYENTDRIYYYKNNNDYSKYRWTLDTIEDFNMIKVIYNEFYKGKHNFYMNDIVSYLEAHPEVHAINVLIEQKKIKDTIGSDNNE